MKKYKLLKELPGYIAGDIIQVLSSPITGKDIFYYFGGEINTKEYPDFFEEIIEKKTYDTLEKDDKVYFLALDGTVVATAYFDIKYHSRGEIFLTREEAEDEHKRREWANRKDKFIPEEGEKYYVYSAYYKGRDEFIFNYASGHDLHTINQGLAFRSKHEYQDAIDNHDIVRLFYTIR